MCLSSHPIIHPFFYRSIHLAIQPSISLSSLHSIHSSYIHVVIKRFTIHLSSLYIICSSVHPLTHLPIIYSPIHLVSHPHIYLIIYYLPTQSIPSTHPFIHHPSFQPFFIHLAIQIFTIHPLTI
jgi:hypothetical protein